MLETIVPVNKVYRYHTNGFDDYRWGSIYRNIQTVLHYFLGETPKLPEIVKECGVRWNADEPIRWENRRGLRLKPHDAKAVLQRRLPSPSLELVIFSTNPNVKTKTELYRGGTAVYNVEHEVSGIRNRIGKCLQQDGLVIIDDGEYAYIIAGMRVDDEGDVDYQLLDPHYGLAYATRDHRENWRLKNVIGLEQPYGSDHGKVRWVPGPLFNRGPSSVVWKMLFINCDASKNSCILL